jgi:hypothetical protein
MDQNRQIIVHFLSLFCKNLGELCTRPWISAINYFLCRPYTPTCDNSIGGTFENCMFCLSHQGDNFVVYFLNFLIQGLAMPSFWLLCNYLHLMIVLWMWKDLIVRWQWQNLHHLVLPIKLLISLSCVRKWT